MRNRVSQRGEMAWPRKFAVWPRRWLNRCATGVATAGGMAKRQRGHARSPSCPRRKFAHGLAFPASLMLTVCVASAQTPILVEDYEFASSDEAAEAGVIDMTDAPNTPAFYENGDLPDGASQGLHSIGTEAAFCINPDFDCVAGTFIGFRRLVMTPTLPFCPGGGRFVPLNQTYGDPNHPGPVPADQPLSALTVLCDAYGDGSFADGPTGTHFWVNLVDCEGEVFEFVNYSESALNFDVFTLDLVMGQGLIRLSPDSLVEVPNGDRLLTEIAASECFIQDTDFPPTTVGDWYIDNLRIVEAGMPGDFDSDGDVDLTDYASFRPCLRGPVVITTGECLFFDHDDDTHVDLQDAAWFMNVFGAGL